MIISDNKARWLEIQLYYYAKDIYNIHKRGIDVMTLTDAIATIAGAKADVIKKAIRLMQSDTYYKPSIYEVIVIAKRNGKDYSEIGKRLNLSKQNVYNKYTRNKDNFTAWARFGIDITYELEKFFETYNKLDPIGRES